jgi:RNase H-like domain found in reverse transcriptase/Reverse transcriptase (RNA-dependent DNA polymerase)/Integrase zinc binding domain/Chromo (CHRromatin Organisation MOdifier) domain
MYTIAQIGSKNPTSFTVQAKLKAQDSEIPIEALCDTGAETRLLVSPKIAKRAVKRTRATIEKLKRPILLTDYRLQDAGLVTHVLHSSLIVDNRMFKNETFWITETGHDVFIGQNWFVEKDVWLHPRTRTLKWPEPKIVTESPTITRIAALHAQVRQDPRQERWRSQPTPTEPVPIEPVNCTDKTVNIASFRERPDWKTNNSEPIPFPSDEDPEHIALVRALLPERLKHLEGFFSKKASTKLPPYRTGHDVVLELKSQRTGTPPTFRTPIGLIPLEKQTTDELLKLGFIERCMDPTPASVLFVPKPHSDDKRFCIDYRWVNQFLKDRLVPAPDINGTIANCRNAVRFSKIDIIRAFNRLRMAMGSEYLTAFRTRQGTFQWKVLPFGLKVGPAWWQDFINAQLNELLDQFASAYADDVLIYSNDKDEDVHWEQCEEIIHRLNRAELQGDIKKSRFNVTVIDYLGIVMEAGVGIRIDPEKVKAIRNWKFEDLTNKTAVRSFLGLCNYVRMFCHHASGTAEPLNRLLKKDATFEKGPEQQNAFNELKRLACEAPVMAFFVPGRKTKVETDASRNATGGVIWQEQPNGEWKPVGYFSKTMTPAERAYPIQDRELLAVVQTLQQYQPELLGTKFFVLTDHQALVYYSTKRTLSTRQVRWADFLSNFDITFKYRPGKDNVAADALSRKTADLPTVKARELEERTMALIPPERIERPINATAIVVERPEVHGADLVDLIRTENELQNLGKHEGKLIVPELTSDSKLFLRTALIREAHEPTTFGHGGQNKTVQSLKRRYHWDSLNKDVRRFIRNCRECGRNKGRHDRTPGLLHPLPIPNHVWEHVLVDGKDMPTDRFGYDYVWVFICKFSKLIARLPAKKTDTATDIAKRYYRYLYRFLGVPLVWITDNAGPFVSEFMDTINKFTGTKHRHGSALHPQTQGGVEITNQELDQQLRFYIDKYQTEWSIHLAALDFGHNASWHSSIDMSPLKVALGTDPRDPLSTDLPVIIPDSDQKAKAQEILQQTKTVQDLARASSRKAQQKQTDQANKKRRPVDFQVGDCVYLKKKGFATNAPTTRLESQWAGPYRVTREIGHSFELDLPSTFKGKNLFHADRLRKAANDPLPQQDQPPPPPEEINGEPEYTVTKILASRLFGRTKRLEYQVEWQGYDPDDTWYPAENFKNSGVAIESFHRQYPDAAGPPARLTEWIRAAAEDSNDPPHDNDNVAQHGEMNARRQRKRRHS